MTIHDKAISTIRALGLEQITTANSGHGGMVLGAAPIMYATYMSMHFDPSNPTWFNRDRFVLSAGHGSALLYAANHLFGWPIKREELKTFRRLGSRLHGHPELDPEIGVEATTGPLGQGFAMAVGMAVGEKKLAAENKQVDHYTYCLVGDGCLQEGITYETAALAGLWKLNKLIVIYDSNNVQLDGTTDLADNENVRMRFEAANWNVIQVKDGMNWQSVDAAIKNAKSQKEKPTLVIATTTIGVDTGVAGTHKAHGLILPMEEIAKLRMKWGIAGEPFTVPADVEAHFTHSIRGRLSQKDVNVWRTGKKIMVTAEGKPMALRDAGHRALQQIAKQSPRLFGASADISSTTKAYIADGSWWSHENPTGTDLACGVREFGMAAIVNGLAIYGYTPYCSTFLAFSDYMRGAIRLSALMNVPVHYIFSHDGLGHAQDGPTHQGPEHLAALRLIPNLDVFRPCDDVETANVYEYIYTHNRPSVTVLSRGGVELPRKGNVILHGTGGLKGYVFEGKLKPQVALVATGTEVALAIQVQLILENQGVGAVVYSAPNLKIFNINKAGIMGVNAKLPSHLIEMGSPLWDTFGHSGTEDEIREKLGFTLKQIAVSLLDRLA